MNFRKALTSVISAAMISGVMMMPSVQAADYGTTMTVNEAGSLTYQLNTTAALFNTTVDVTNTQSGLSTSYRNMSINDSHSYSLGYVLTVESTDLVNTTNDSYYIDNTNLSWNLIKRGWGDSCMSNGFDRTPIGGNSWQTVTWANALLPLGAPATVASANSGIGCGNYAVGGDLNLVIPAGTYTANGTAVYQGSITVTNTLGVGDGN